MPQRLSNRLSKTSEVVRFVRHTTGEHRFDLPERVEQITRLITAVSESLGDVCDDSFVRGELFLTRGQLREQVAVFAGHRKIL
jgi:predicted neutral ceramidase superfamily lipid hydrolase